ncbi:uncharacterized protein LOC125541561 [Triticum urartu]|uniref:uncharacterized protein LOC125541561 n=1 Tax=Triticum urartu TaxID=4572 RepID=UPI002043E0F9|nr:uncharacterized protein LOC125541561 [Triticum urartu]
MEPLDAALCSTVAKTVGHRVRRWSDLPRPDDLHLPPRPPHPDAAASGILVFAPPPLLFRSTAASSRPNTDAPNQHHGDATITSSTGSPSLRHTAAGSACSGRFPPGAASNPCLLRCHSSSARCSSAASSA